MLQKNLESLDNEVKEVLNIFIEKYLEDPNLYGILLTGSYAIGDASKNSDLDIHLIFKDLDWRERGNTWINGYEIEYFINPEKQIYEYFKTEDPLRPNSAHMFANGIVLYTKPESNILSNLIKKAKVIIDTPLNNLSETEIEFAKYYIDDVYKDLEDLILEKNDLAYHITAGELFKYCIDLFFKINRSIKEKNKRISKQVLKMDEKFYYIIQNVVKSHYNIDDIKKLVNYSEKLLKGRRTVEWKLKSNLRIKEN